MRIIATTFAGLALAATGVVGVASGASAAPPAAATLQIRHQVAGCHMWSADGGPYRASQSLTLKPGARLTVTDNDVMTHRLVRVSGPRVTYALTRAGMPMMGTLKVPYAAGMMPHMGAALRVTFTHKGVYAFKTVAGEDYMKGVKTTGADNVLRLVVTVR